MAHGAASAQSASLNSDRRLFEVLQYKKTASAKRQQQSLHKRLLGERRKGAVAIDEFDAEHKVALNGAAVRGASLPMMPSFRL
jgi:hypothetical protein